MSIFRTTKSTSTPHLLKESVRSQTEMLALGDSFQTNLIILDYSPIKMRRLINVRPVYINHRLCFLQNTESGKILLCKTTKNNTTPNTIQE